MKSVVLAVEHRKCRCGREYTCPNPKLLARVNVDNLQSADYLTPLKSQIPFNTTREILHIEVKIDNCHECWPGGLHNQMELWPPAPELPMEYYEGIMRARTKKEKAEAERKKNPHGLWSF